jgi:hypothetical protein
LSDTRPHHGGDGGEQQPYRPLRGAPERERQPAEQQAPDDLEQAGTAERDAAIAGRRHVDSLQEPLVLPEARFELTVVERRARVVVALAAAAVGAALEPKREEDRVPGRREPGGHPALHIADRHPQPRPGETGQHATEGQHLGAHDEPRHAVQPLPDPRDEALLRVVVDGEAGPRERLVAVEIDGRRLVGVVDLPEGQAPAAGLDLLRHRDARLAQPDHHRSAPTRGARSSRRGRAPSTRSAMSPPPSR